MQWIEVGEHGLTVSTVYQPLVSVFGKHMRPGSTSTDHMSWQEISSVSISLVEVAPHGERWVELTIDLTYGEYVEVRDSAEGFNAAVHQLCQLSGLPLPDAASLDTAGIAIWPGAHLTAQSEK